MPIRVLVDRLGEAGDKVTLSPTESHHLVVVRRSKAGDPVQLLDGQGGIGEGKLIQAHKNHAEVHVAQIRQQPARVPAVTLAVAVPKNRTMDTVVHQATEMGVRRIVPLLSAHGEVLPKGDRARAKQAKWQQIAQEAQKQCGNPWTPVVEAPVVLADWLQSPLTTATGLVAALHPEARPLPAVTAACADLESVTVLVGPEGDFSGQEYAAIFAADYVPVSLGPLVLKVDTACVALLAGVFAARA